MGKPKVLKGTITAKVRCTIEDNVKDEKALNNKGNWELNWVGADLLTGEVTAVEVIKASVDK